MSHAHLSMCVKYLNEIIIHTQKSAAWKSSNLSLKIREKSLVALKLLLTIVFKPYLLQSAELLTEDEILRNDVMFSVSRDSGDLDARTGELSAVKEEEDTPVNVHHQVETEIGISNSKNTQIEYCFCFTNDDTELLFH